MIIAKLVVLMQVLMKFKQIDGYPCPKKTGFFMTDFFVRCDRLPLLSALPILYIPKILIFYGTFLMRLLHYF